MKLAIVIVHYNTCGDLERCLDSLTAYPPACEHGIIVVDNASSEPGLAELQERFPAVQWIKSSENLGYAGGANRGIAAAGAEYYLLLNPDIVAQPGAVDALIDFAAAFPKAGIVGPQLLNEDGTIQDSCRRFYTFRTLLLRRTFLGKIFRKSNIIDRHLMRDFDHRSEQPVDWVLGGCLLVRRSAMERTGPMDERFFLYFEDVDWCYRMWQAGFNVLYTPSARFVHRHRRASARGAFHRSFWLHLGSLISFYEKWGMLVYLVKKWRGPLSVLLLWVLDMTALGTAFVGAYLLRAAANPWFAEALYPLGEYRPLLQFAALLVSITFLLGGRYRMSRLRLPRSILVHLKQVGTVSLLLLASTYLSHQQVFSRAVLLIFVPLFAVASLLGELLFHALRRRMERGYLSLERTLLVGELPQLRDWLLRTTDLRWLGIDAVGYLTDRSETGSTALPPLGQGEVPWLGSRLDIPDVVTRYRVSQVVFWGQPRTDPRERQLLATLRRQRIRLRWRMDEAWLLAAGVRSEYFGDEVSAVLEPAAGSMIRMLGQRVVDLVTACVLIPFTLVPYLWQRFGAGGIAAGAVRQVRILTDRGDPFPLSVACHTTGKVRTLGWQLPMAVALLRGRLGLFGARPQPERLAGVEPDEPEPGQFWQSGLLRPGLSGIWAIHHRGRSGTRGVAGGDPLPNSPSPFSFPLLWSTIRDILKQLLLDPGGLDRLPSGTDNPSPENAVSRSHREVS
ncbi:MAG: glycosyltransferase [bacterium]